MRPQSPFVAWRALGLRPVAALTAAFSLALLGAAHAQVEPPDPWTDLEGGLPGGAGLPVLTAGGSLFGGTLVAIDVSEAAASQPGMIFVSGVSNPVPFYGGILQANPAAMTVPFATDDSGEFTWAFTMPLGIVEGTNFWFQAGIADPGAVQGVALTNALRARTPAQTFDVMGVYLDAVLDAQKGVDAGYLPQATLDYLVNNYAQLSSNGAALLDAITGAMLGSSYAVSGPGGGVVSGATWLSESLTGLDVMTGTVQVAWVTDGNTNRFTEHSAAGHMLLGSMWVEQLGQKWKDHCGGGPENRVYRECANYQLHWKQKWGFFVVASGITKAETLCAPCPDIHS